MLKRLVQSAAHAFKLEVVPQWRLPELAFVSYLKRVFHQLDITSVVDVGANEGQFRDLLRNQVGFSGSIHSFEPDPALAAQLAVRARQDQNWTVYPVALGAAPGRGRFNVMRNPCFNSFYEPSAQQGGTFEQDGNTVVRTIDVEVKTLDGAMGSLPDLGRTYLKLDAQGFQREIVKGASNVLRQIAALQTEVSLKLLYSQGTFWNDDIDFLSGHGFAVSNLFLVAQDNNLRAFEFDCVMVRDPTLAAALGRPGLQEAALGERSVPAC